MNYITIIKGDDTNFIDDQFIVIHFKTDIDMSGFKAIFSLGEVKLTYGELSSKRIEIILSKEITSELETGKQFGELKLIDTKNRVRTITSVIPFLVQKTVNSSPTYINNTLEFVTELNNEYIEIIMETAGLTVTDAINLQKVCENCRDYCVKSTTQILNTSEIVAQCVQVCEEQAAIAKQEAAKATAYSKDEINALLLEKQSNLVSGTGINIENNQINNTGVLYVPIYPDFDISNVPMISGTTYEIID